ncbi:MAG: hypothetical protein H7Y38_11205 [Armatimonadetes bacterium]|nr:hypothetical protein [Armatimonadota bacterium]
MIRFSASEEETLGLLRFLERRARTLFGGSGTGLLFVPLISDTTAPPRPRRTSLSLQRTLRDADTAQLWGIRLASDADHPYTTERNAETGKFIVDTEASRLILLALSAVEQSADKTERRREGLLELRDWVEDIAAPEPLTEGVPTPKGVVFLPQTSVARDLVARCTRRLRRRGTLLQNRWHVPPGLPQDEAK